MFGCPNSFLCNHAFDVSRGLKSSETAIYVIRDGQQKGTISAYLRVTGWILAKCVLRVVVGVCAQARAFEMRF